MTASTMPTRLDLHAALSASSRSARPIAYCT
jgi:hypothetical protein